MLKRSGNLYPIYGHQRGEGVGWEIGSRIYFGRIFFCNQNSRLSDEHVGLAVCYLTIHSYEKIQLSDMFLCRNRDVNIFTF